MAISIAEVKSSRLSDDKREIIVAGKGKYIGAVEIAVSAACVGDLIDVLMRARGSLEGAPRAATARPGAPAPGAVPANPDEVQVEVAKTCRVIADQTGRRLVVLIFNHRLDNQRAYALPPDGARKVAQGLTQGADAIEAGKSAEPSAPGAA